MSIFSGEVSPVPRFEIRKSHDGQYYFVLFAKNGKIIARSEEYISKEGCENGIKSVKESAPVAETIDNY